MRRTLAPAATALPVIMLLALAACSDNPSGPVRFDPNAAAVFSAAPVSTLDAEVDALIAQAFSGGHRSTVTARWSTIKRHHAAEEEALAR